MIWSYAIEIARGIASSLGEKVRLYAPRLDDSHNDSFECVFDPEYPYIVITKVGEEDDYKNYFKDDADLVLSLEWTIMDFNYLKKRLFAKEELINEVIGLMKSCKCDGVFV